MKITIIAILLILSVNAKSQDPTFSQFNSVPLYFNPAFAGSVEKSRLALSYRNQWAGFDQTYHVSYDRAVKRLHGGVGLLLYNDRVSYSGQSSSLNVFYAGLAYAAKFNLFGKIAISPAVKIGYRKTTADVAEYSCFGCAQNEDTRKVTKNSIDVSTGLVINTEKFYMGFAVDHINNPEVGLSESATLPKKYVAQLGYTFQKNDESVFAITPSVLYQQQQDFSILQCNLSLKYRWAILGLGYTSNTYSGMIGYYSKKVIVGYSYEYYPVASNLINSNHTTTNEISIRYFFTLKKNKDEITK